MSIENLTPMERCKLTDYVFDEIITEDKSNGYVCICFEAPEEQENNGQGQSGRGHHFLACLYASFLRFIANLLTDF